MRIDIAAMVSRLSQVKAMRVSLAQEEEELTTAIRVARRFAEEGWEDEDLAAPEPDLEKRRIDILERAEAEADRQEAELQKRKPESAPTVPEMIHEILLRPHLLDDPGMEPKDILNEIRKRWWPDAPSTSVGPIAWRMWKKEGRLVKDGNLYSLPPHGDRAPPGSSSAELTRLRGLLDDVEPKGARSEGEDAG
jgi:hypothetical protein